MEGATRRAHLVGTSSSSEFKSHAILPTWLIVVGFSPKLLRRIIMVRFIYLRRHLGTIPPSFFLTDTDTSACDRPRRGHIRQSTIRQLRRSVQGAPVTPFGDQRRLLLQDLGDENRSDEPKPCPTPWQRNIDFGNSAEQITAPWKTPLRRDGKIYKSKNKDQGTATSAADPAASLIEKIFKSKNSEPWHLANLADCCRVFPKAAT